MRANWRLLAAVALGTLVSSAILSATAIYADAIRDLGLRYALAQPAPGALDVQVTREVASARTEAFRQSNARVDRAVRTALAGAVRSVQRQGASQTLYLTAPGAAVNEADQSRPRAQLRFRDDVEGHLTLTAGAFPRGGSTPAPTAVPVLLGAEAATRNRVAVGDRFALHPWWDASLAPLMVQVAGIARPTDATDPYWSGSPPLFEEPNAIWETFLFLLPEDAFFATLTERLPSASAAYRDRYGVDQKALNARIATSVAAGLEGLRPVIAATERGVAVETVLPAVLRSFDARLFFVRIPLFVLLLQIGGIVAYYLVMVATMLVERQAAEMAVLRSRGASPLQLLFQSGVEGLILAVAAAAIGPLLAAAVISALGPTPSFRALSGGGPLEVHVSSLAYAFAGAGALIALAAFMLPAWRATHTTVVEFRRASARPRPTPLLLRYYLDVALVLLLALLFWRLRQEEQLFTRTLFGGRQSDPLLLATPTVLMVTAGVVFLRLFPLLLRLLAWTVGRVAGAAALVGVRSLARDPSHYARLVLMLMLATGVGMFGATFSATLERSYNDRARYPVGADVRATDLRALFDRGDEAFLHAMHTVPADDLSAVARVEGSALANGKAAQLQILGVDPATFADVAYFRDDFATQPLATVLEPLARNAPKTEIAALPDDARQLGLWAKLPDIRGPLSLVAVVRDGDGRRGTLLLGTARPGDPATREWRFFASGLDRARGTAGRNAPPLRAPYTLQSLYIATQSAITAQRGVALLGPLLTTTTPPGPAEANVDTEPAATAFAGARPALDFATPAFEVITGQRPARTPDTLRADQDTPPGAAASARYEWFDARIAPRDRGIRPRTDGEPVALALARGTADTLQVQPGDRFQVLVGGVYLDAMLTGTFTLFPTYDSSGSRPGFAVAHIGRLTEAVNLALPSRAVTLNEAWFGSAEPAATRAALTVFQPQVLLDTAGERARAKEDPLIAAGWAGILGISFATVLMLSAIGFVLYSYLTAQQRALEFAILRTLGFSRVQVFLVVALEYAVIVVAGMGLGTVVGLQVGRRMMDVFAVSEAGSAVLPPFALAVSWASVVTVWVVLGLAFVQTIGAVVLLYLRLAIHRALRVGEG